MSEQIKNNIVSSYADPEDYFNEITREFIIDEVIHEDMTKAPAVTSSVDPAIVPDIAFADIPKEIQELLQPFNEVPSVLLQPLAAEPSPPIVPEPRLAPSLEKAFAQANIWQNFKKEILIAGAVVLLFVSILFMVQQKKSGIQVEQQDQWQLEVERPTFDLAPKYHDWSEVENDYAESAK